MSIDRDIVKDERAITPEKLLPKPKIQYLLSSKKGLGHVSRAVSILKELGKGYDVTIRANPKTHKFISQNIDVVDIELRGFAYKASLTSMGLLNETEFIEANREWLDEMGTGDLIISDFPAETILLRKYFMEKDDSLDEPTVIGVYHSCEVREDFGDEVAFWQEKGMQVINSTDVSFLINPVGDNKGPHITTEGTLLVPLDSVVRMPTKKPEVVKSEIGLNPEDNFIALAGGMVGKIEIDKMLFEVSRVAREFGRKVVYIQYDDSPYEGECPDNVVVIRKIPDGHNILAAADMVIAKPGMQTLSEAAVYGVPLVLVADNHPERIIKTRMLSKLTGLSIDDCVVNFEAERSEVVEKLRKLIDRGLNKKSEYYQDTVHNDAPLAASIINDFMKEGEIASTTEDLPRARVETVEGKSSKILSLKESRDLSNLLLKDVRETIVYPLLESGNRFSCFAFGGIAKGRLREDSDADVLIVVKDDDAAALGLCLNGLLISDDLPADRLSKLCDGEIETLRLSSRAVNGVPINISVMKHSSYNKIFTPSTHHFVEEPVVSDKPYYVTDFKGEDRRIAKMRTKQVNGERVIERQSPATQFIEGVAILGVKQRMLLLQEKLHDGLSLGNPTRKLMRGVTRAICYWNNLYEYDEFGNVTGIKRSAYFEQYFFRLLRDPVSMLSPRKFKQLHNLFFNELRRIDLIAKMKKGG